MSDIIKNHVFLSVPLNSTATFCMEKRTAPTVGFFLPVNDYATTYVHLDSNRCHTCEIPIHKEHCFVHDFVSPK